MSNAENKYGFKIGFILVLFLNIAIYIGAYTIFQNRPDDVFLARNNNSLQTFFYACLLIELAFFGLFQYIYVLPIAYWQSMKDNQRIVGGMIISSLIVIALNCCSFYITLNPIG